MAPPRRQELVQRTRDLEARLSESEDTLRAIRSGEVDAIVISRNEGDSIYTLKGADEAYRQIVEEMTEGALTLALDGLILFSNERFAGLMGMPLDRVIGSRLFDFIGTENTDVLTALRSEWLAAGKAEVTIHPPEGAPVPAYLSWKRVKQDGLQCLSVVITDLSEQRRNAAIVADEMLARSILEQASEAMVVTDLQGKIIRASRAADLLAGVPVFQRHFDDVFQIRIGAKGRIYPYRDILTEVQGSTAVERVEATAATRDNRTMQLLFTSAPLAGQDGNLLGCIITLIDVTERKRVEDALRASNEDLRQFAFAASHDLQEPLRVITSYSQLLVKNYRGDNNEEVVRAAGFISEGTHRMQKLLEGLLAFTQLNEDNTNYTRAVDLNFIFQRVVKNCQLAIEESLAEVTREQLPMVRGYEPHLVQLLQNLIGNAIKYRGVDPPRIRVSGEQIDGFCQLAVADNGMGIDPQYHERIFGVFKRLHGKEIPGTGIGLALCKRVVERAGGKIWVESELGRGATFFCTLPSASRGEL